MRLLGIREMHKRGAPGATAALFWRVLAVLVIGALLAHWTWVLFAPGSAQVLPATLPAADYHAERLFGIAAVSAVSVAPVMPNVRLVGVFAGTPGFAILELDGKRQVGMVTGSEIVARAKLVEVAFDHVTIERDGVRQKIQLEGKNSAIKSSAAASLQPIQLPGVATVAAAVSVPVATPASAANAVSGVDPAMQQRMMYGRGGL